MFSRLTLLVVFFKNVPITATERVVDSRMFYVDVLCSISYLPKILSKLLVPQERLLPQFRYHYLALEKPKIVAVLFLCIAFLRLDLCGEYA
jgi:hypothetical protein